MSLQNLTDEKIATIMEVNNASLVKMTRIVLPGMLERKKGAIVNVGSLEGNIPVSSSKNSSKDSSKASSMAELLLCGEKLLMYTTICVRMRVRVVVVWMRVCPRNPRNLRMRIEYCFENRVGRVNSCSILV